MDDKDLQKLAQAFVKKTIETFYDSAFPAEHAVLLHISTITPDLSVLEMNRVTRRNKTKRTTK